MIQGSGTIANYGAYISNCTLGQTPYKIPVTGLADVQEYINIGGQPDAAEYQLIHTCGPHAGAVEALTSSSYVIGQKPNDDWYGVFKGFTGNIYPLSCFVVAVTLTFGAQEVIYFSEEYCIDNYCTNLTLLRGCYGNLNNKISYDCEGVYFGTHATENPPLGDTTVVYQHQLYLRDVEVTLQSIKNTFKQGRTRNFRTEKERIYQFWGELIPEWYMGKIDAIFYRGEVWVGSTKYLVNETGYEKVEDCKKTWKPTATFRDSCLQSFSCEADPCTFNPESACCDPLGVSASVTNDGVDTTCCDPEIFGAFVTSCKDYINETGSTVWVRYTACDGTVYINEPIESGQSICIVDGSGSGPGFGFLTPLGDC
jgi:hypothetical protein